MKKEETLGEAMRRLRKEKGITLKAAGDYVEKSPQTISSWESGYRQMNADVMIRLCEFYGVEDINVFKDTIKKTSAPIEEDTEEEIAEHITAIANRSR